MEHPSERLPISERKLIQLLPTKEQHQTLRIAAAYAGIPMTHYILGIAIEIAKKEVKKIQNKK